MTQQRTPGHAPGLTGRSALARLPNSRLEQTAELGLSLVRGVAGAGLLIVDAELRILRAEGHAHLNHAAVVGRRVRDVIPATAWALLETPYAAALGGEVQSFEFAASSDGSVHWIRMAPIHDDAEVIGVMVLSQDTTTTVTAARQLAASERLQRSVLDVLDEGVVVIGLEGQLVQANPAACTILGLDHAAALVDASWWEAFGARHAGDGSPLDVGATAMRTGEEIRDVAVEADRPDGTTISLSLNYQPLRDDAGELNGMLLSFRDVTGREREHRRLVETQERLREAHEVARLASWEWQPETDEVLTFHGLAELEFEAGEASSLGAILAVVAPRERQEAREDLASIVNGERDATVRRHGYDHPSGAAWLETRTRAVRDDDGRLLCIRGTSQDVTEQELAKQEAARERDLFQSTLDSLPAHITVLGEHGEIVMTNRAWEEFAAANDAEAPGLGANYLAACDGAGDDEWAMRAAAGLRAIMAGTETRFSLEYPCHSPTVERWFTLRAARYEGAGDARVVVAHDDVTQRHQAQAQVTTQAALLEEVDVAVTAADLEGRITHWNRGAEDLYGWTCAEAQGRDVTTLVSVPGSSAGAEVLAEVRRSGSWSGEFAVRKPDGSTLAADLRVRAMVDSDGRPMGVIGVAVDVSERVASERATRAARDYMRAVADSVGEGLFTLDTDGRLIYLNEAGEKLLGWTRVELLGRVIHDIVHFRRPDGSAYPIAECPISGARGDGETQRVEEDMFICRDGRELPVSYTASPFETEDGIKGCVVVFEDISERKAKEASLQGEAEKLGWIGRIQDALAENRFLLYAQPIVDLHSGETVQRELLLRMREPDGNIIGPGAYLHIAERYGLIGEIDRWVITRGAAIAATGRPVEINLSARSVGDRSILEHIERCIERSGADPTLLVFEITETALIEDEAAARAFAAHLHELGCKLALDDFGTGYGGFTYLKQLPLDYLKIDIEFVRDLATNPASSHVVQAVVALARGFNLQTVAEGVEDAETLELLRELGVDLAQGYHIARPGPFDETTPEWGRPTHVKRESRT